MTFKIFDENTNKKGENRFGLLLFEVLRNILFFYFIKIDNQIYNEFLCQIIDY